MWRHDFLPYGEEIYGGQAGRDGAFDNLPQRFTGQERDGETTPNLDYFQARYFSGEQGRFLSADTPLVDQDPSDPHSWNLYSYGRNNPLINSDPTGNACVYNGSGDYNDADSYADDDSGGQSCTDAFGSPTPPSTTTNASVPYQFGEQAFVGFYNLFFNNQLSGADDLALGLFEVHPSNAFFSITKTLCDSCGTVAAVAAITNPARLLGDTRSGLLQQAMQSRKLRNIINDLYRPGANIGRGSTADAIRYELSTGLKVGGKSHLKKGFLYRDSLLRLWRDPNLNASDRAIVKQLLTDLQNALSGN